MPVCIYGRLLFKSTIKINFLFSDTKSFKCKLCTAAFKFSASLIIHEKKIHKLERKNKWICDICKKVFSYRCLMIKHKKVHQRAFKCNKCYLSFNLISNLEFHMTRHPHNDNGEFVCNVCGKTFLERKKWVLHKNIHLSSISK